MSKRKFGPCIKCQGTDIYVDWHRLASIAYDTYGPDCQWDERKKLQNPDEHLYCHCRQCSYAWHEKVSKE